MYMMLNGKWGEYTRKQILASYPKEDHKFVNSFGMIDKPETLSDDDDLVAKMADSIRPYHEALSYSIAVLEDGVRKIYCRPRNPCLGNLTKYQVDYPEEGEFNQTKPGDLYYVFPKGRPIGISLFINHFTDLSKALIEDSPVSEALTGCRIVLDETSKKYILVQPNLDIDPNVFWMGVKYLKHVNPNNTKLFLDLKEKIGSFSAISLLAWSGMLGYGLWASYERLISRNPHRIAKGKYSDGYGYTRSNCEYIFSSKNLKFGETKYYNNPTEEKTEDEHILFSNVINTLKLQREKSTYSCETVENLLKCEEYLRTELEKKEVKND